MDREKVIKGIQECDLNGGLIGNCPYKGILQLLKEQEQMYYTLEHDWRMCRELLKEQENLGTELTNAIELIHKKNERIKKLEEEIETLTRWRANAGAFD